jgi:8-oxo-dGTP pyrophosphatase MutT (NUDIX family)
MAISGYLNSLREHVGHQLLMVPGVAAVIRNSERKILLQRNANGWSLPAGAVDPGETPAQAVVREVSEETGLSVRPLRVLGVFGGADGFRYT